MQRPSIFYAIIVLLICPALNADNADHLTPEPAYLTYINDYTVELKNLMAAGFEHDVVFRALIFPSFGAEKLLGIKKRREGDYAVILLTPNSSIKLKYYDEKGYAKKPGSHLISIQNLSRDIPDDVAIKFLAIMEHEILNAKFDIKPPLSIDGTMYNFSINLRPHYMTGARLVANSSNSRMNRLAALTDSLVNYVLDKEDLKETNRHIKYLRNL